MSAQRGACWVTQGEFRGWEACTLENGLIRVVAVPDIGGRVMAYDLDGYPFVFVDPTLAGKLFSAEENQGDGSLAAWKNYGGDKSWPAPQGWDNDDQWHGPPDPILDTGRYSLDTLSADGDHAVIAMSSPPDTARTGLRINRRLTLSRGSTRVTLAITFHNITPYRTIRWSIWDVMQLRAERHLPGSGVTHAPECVVTAPLNPDSVFPKGYNVMFGADDNPQWQVDADRGLFRAPYLWQIGKVGLDSPAGWIAFSHTGEGCAFTERFAYEPDGEYPDGGATLEVWTVGAGEVGNLNYEGSGIYLMETEVLSPLRTIPPGAQTRFSITWGACRCDGEVIDTAEGGVTTGALHAAADGVDGLHLSGKFGVFDRGTLALTFYDGQGAALTSETLGTADPLTPVTLDQPAARPDGARSVTLNLISEADGQSRPIARTALP